jgi:hypothetical protein
MTADMSAWLFDDKEAARAALNAAGVQPIGGPFLDFRDPWGNRVEIVGYDNIQFGQGSKRSARHGPGAIDQERKREKGASRKRNRGELDCLRRPFRDQDECRTANSGEKHKSF